MKRENNSNVDISDSNTYRSKHNAISMPLELESSDRKYNGHKYSEFDGKFEDIEDQEYSQIKTNINS